MFIGIMRKLSYFLKTCRLRCNTVVQEISGNVFFNPIPSHSQWFSPIPIPRFGIVLFPFLPHSHWLFPFRSAPIPIRVDIFCQFITALLLIVFSVAEILIVKDTLLHSWWAMTVECVTVRQVPSEADVAPLTGLFSSSDWKWENVKFSILSIPLKPFPFP